MPYIAYRYKLRSAGPMSFDVGDMVTHTFMAEERRVTTYEATACFLTSQDMAGQFNDDGKPGKYESASYNALQYTMPSTDGPVMMFEGEEVEKPRYISEESMGVCEPKFIGR